MDKIAIDNNILTLYLGMNRHQSEWAINNKYATILIDDLRKKKIPVYLPPQVVMETLCTFQDKEKRAEVFDLLRKTFRLIAFDSKAAVVGADILLQGNYLRELKDNDTPRSHIKTDAQIIASCRSKGITRIYTNDKAMLKMKVNHLEISPLPKAHVQIPLFPEGETD